MDALHAASPERTFRPASASSAGAWELAAGLRPLRPLWSPLLLRLCRCLSGNTSKEHKTSTSHAHAHARDGALPDFLDLLGRHGHNAVLPKRDGALPSFLLLLGRHGHKAVLPKRDGATCWSRLAPLAVATARVETIHTTSTSNAQKRSATCWSRLAWLARVERCACTKDARAQKMRVQQRTSRRANSLSARRPHHAKERTRNPRVLPQKRAVRQQRRAAASSKGLPYSRRFRF